MEAVIVTLADFVSGLYTRTCDWATLKYRILSGHGGFHDMYGTSVPSL